MSVKQFTPETIWKSYKSMDLVEKINKTKFKPPKEFIKSLKKILDMIRADSSIVKPEEAAYLLGTAYVEAKYSLQRWEYDYGCGLFGKPYGINGPCAKALNYYRDTLDGRKKNYYSSDVGVDSNGIPYFGRGLIQLTGLSNYKLYGDLIGKNLVQNPELALDETISYQIAVLFLKRRTFRHVHRWSETYDWKYSGNYIKRDGLYHARRSVNGGVNDLDAVNDAFITWFKLLSIDVEQSQTLMANSANDKVMTKKKENVSYTFNVASSSSLLSTLSPIPNQVINNPEDTDILKLEDGYGLEIPVVKINNYIFSRNEIEYIHIDCTGFLPKITLKIITKDQIFLGKEMPKDGDIISIAIRPRSKMIRLIRNDYVITGAHSVKNSTEISDVDINPSSLTFYGELFIPGLRSWKNTYSFEGTVYEALQDFAKKYGLGFVSNESNTNDKQVWIKGSTAGEYHINDLVEHAWADEHSFYSAWIDLYYNLNFVNVNKQLVSSENEVDIAITMGNLDKEFLFGSNELEEKNSTSTPKVFSNFTEFIPTPFYIKSWRPLNRSTAITFEIGSKMICEMYEHNDKLYTDPGNQKYWSIPVEPTYDAEKVKNSILLRGRSSYIRGEDNKEQARVNYNYPDLYVKAPWSGIQYTITNPDADRLEQDGNHHRNYQLARIQNLINKKELDKLNVHIEVVGSNLNIIRGEKIPIALLKTRKAENLKIHGKFTENLDMFYSGWYYVKGFNLEWKPFTRKFQSNFTHEFILTRREWPTPVEVQALEATEINKT